VVKSISFNPKVRPGFRPVLALAPRRGFYFLLITHRAEKAAEFTGRIIAFGGTAAKIDSIFTPRWQTRRP
jgi:hypothetical protein